MMRLKSGTLLQRGKYQIEKVLGQGGFGITYLAVQTNLKNRKVAIKEFFLKEHCERDSSTFCVSMGTSGSRELVEKFKQKFIKEAETISEFRNHHIITIHDIFEENGTAYYVMEYLSCGSLSNRIPSGGLSESEALGYIHQVSDALSYIHENRILHLDIKPSNILFRKSDEAVLIDFGISKHYDEADGSQTSSTPVGVSRGYAPLEQYKQSGVSQFSPATDIYSLGATLYKLLTGQTPPDADEVNEDGLPPLPSKVSSSVGNAVRTAMAPRRKERPQSVSEFRVLFDDEDTVTPPPPMPPNPRRKNWVWGLAVGLLAVLVLYFGLSNLPKPSVVIEPSREDCDTLANDSIITLDYDAVPEENNNVVQESTSGAYKEHLDHLYLEAESIEDYLALARKGYVKAYAKLADLYLKGSDYENADLYAQKALKAKVDTVQAERIIDVLRAYGYYEF